MKQSYVSECLEYDPDTGIFRWRTRPEAHFVDTRAWRLWNARFSGTIAGTAGKGGYRIIKVGPRQQKAHRIAWLIEHGEPVPAEIDHINGDPSDNRIANLRAASHADNLANANVRHDNPTGVKGVILHKDGRFRAGIKRNGHQYWLGLFVTLEEATAARREAEQQLQGSFAKRQEIGR